GELAAVRRVPRIACIQLQDPLAKLVVRLGRQPDGAWERLDSGEREPERAPAREELFHTVLVRAEGEQERDVERDPGRGPLGIEAGAELVEPRLGQQQDERASKAHASACTRRR